MADPFVIRILNSPYLKGLDALAGKAVPESSEESLLKKRTEAILEMIALYQNRYDLLELEPSCSDTLARKRFFAWHSNAHSDGVVSVFGGRGSGKTTLLLHVCSELLYRNHNHIVLPPILPERFGPGDTLAGWVLTYLKLFLEDNQQLGKKKIRWLTRSGDIDPERLMPSDGENAITALEYLEFLRSQEPLFSHRFARGLAEQNLWAAEYSQEATILLDADVSFVRHWDRFLEFLFKKKGDQKSRPLLVIMIDDADLNPSALPGIIHQLRLLAHRHVVFLFSADRETLQQAMLVRELDGYGGDEVSGNRCREFMIKRGVMKFKELNRLISVRLLKALPKHNMLDIPSFTEVERLNFVPIKKWERNGSAPKKFIDLLDKFRRPYPYAHPFMESLAHYFDFRKRVCAGCCLRIWDNSHQKAPCAFRIGKDEQPDRCLYMDQPEWGVLSESPSKPIDCRKGCALLNNKCERDNAKSAIPSPAVAVLPNAVRGMEQLYYKIEALANQLPSDDGTQNSMDADRVKKQRELFAEAAKAIIGMSMEYYNESISVPPRVKFSELTVSEDSHDDDIVDVMPKPTSSVEVDLSDLRFECAPHSDKTILPVRNDALFGLDSQLDGRFRFYKIGQIEAKLLASESTVEESQHGGQSNKQTQLSNELTQAILFTIDMADHRQLFTNETKGGLVEQFLERSGINESLAFCEYLNRVDNVDVLIDSFAWLTPRWPKTIDFHVFSEGWNFLRRAAARRIGGSSGEVPMDLFWERYLLLVSCVQSGRCIPPESVFELRESSENNGWHLEQALKAFRILYWNCMKERDNGGIESRKQEFVSWFNNYLLFFASTFHFGAEKAKKLLIEWFLIRLKNLREKDYANIVSFFNGRHVDNPFERMLFELRLSKEALCSGDTSQADEDLDKALARLKKAMSEDGGLPFDNEYIKKIHMSFKQILLGINSKKVAVKVLNIILKEENFQQYFANISKLKQFDAIFSHLKNHSDDPLTLRILDWASTLNDINFAIRFYPLLAWISASEEDVAKRKCNAAVHARRVIHLLQRNMLDAMKTSKKLHSLSEISVEGEMELFEQAYRRVIIDSMSDERARRIQRSFRHPFDEDAFSGRRDNGEETTAIIRTWDTVFIGFVRRLASALGDMEKNEEFIEFRDNFREDRMKKKKEARLKGKTNKGAIIMYLNDISLLGEALEYIISSYGQKRLPQRT